MVDLDADRNSFNNWSAWVPRCLCRRYGHDFSSGSRDRNLREEYFCFCGRTPDRLLATTGDVLHTRHALSADGRDLRPRDLWVLSHGPHALASPMEPSRSPICRPNPRNVSAAPRPIPPRHASRNLRLRRRPVHDQRPGRPGNIQCRVKNEGTSAFSYHRT